MTKRFSLAAQIEAVDQQIAHCKRDKKNSLNTYQITRLEAARATLAWLQENECLVKQRLSQ